MFWLPLEDPLSWFGICAWSVLLFSSKDDWQMFLFNVFFWTHTHKITIFRLEECKQTVRTGDLMQLMSWQRDKEKLTVAMKAFYSEWTEALLVELWGVRMETWGGVGALDGLEEEEAEEAEVSCTACMLHSVQTLFSTALIQGISHRVPTKWPAGVSGQVRACIYIL